MSISDGMDPYVFRRQMKRRGSGKEMDEEVFITRQNLIFGCVDNVIKVLSLFVA